MENSTFHTNDELVQSIRSTWTICLVVNCSLLIVHLWIATTTVIYAVKIRKRRSTLGGGRVITCAALASVAPNFRFTTTFALLMTTLHQATDDNCETVIDLGKAAMIIALFFISSFFWIRQRAFYNHPSIGHSFGKCASIFSFSSVALLVGLLLVMIPMSVFPAEYEAHLSGMICGFKNNEKQYAFRNYIYATATLLAQFFLLGLFVHPLRMHRQTQRANTTDTTRKQQVEIPTSSCVTETDSSSAMKNYRLQEPSMTRNMSIKHKLTRSQQSTEKSILNRTRQRKMRVYNLIKRTLILAVIAVVTDLIAMAIISTVIPATEPQIVTRIIYDIDLSVNTATVLLSFDNWTTIVWPFGRRASKLQNENTQITSAAAEGKPNLSATQDQ